MRKIILMGAVGCGKTTLCQALYQQEPVYNKTQAVTYYPEIIDTPGEFVLHRHYYSALTVSAADAQMIGLVQSVTEKEQVFSPGFATMFPKQVIGIITKADLSQAAADVERIEKQLQAAGAGRIFVVSVEDQQGLAELGGFLADKKTQAS